jgi:hypothetical protein
VNRSAIYSLTVDGTQALGFDTGLDSRSFAQARFAQFLTEPGSIVNSDGTVTAWKAGGVVEALNGVEANPSGGATMHIWGPAFTGTRLDLIINNPLKSDEALAAVISWIDAWFDSEKYGAISSPWPCAALIGDTVSVDNETRRVVLFMPENIVRRCMQAESEDAVRLGADQYVHPDYEGAKGAAFTAAAMLYRIFAGGGAFTASTGETLRQDMREGNFLPIRLAAPGLNPDTASLIQEALSPERKAAAERSMTPAPSRSSLLERIRENLNTDRGQPRSGYFLNITETERSQLTDEKEKFLQKKKVTVTARRFMIRNSAIIAGTAAALLVTMFIGMSLAKSRASAPSTAGMDSGTVVAGYYEAFNNLDHEFMEACTARNAGKDDISTAMNLFVITRVRQAYEYGPRQIMPPDEWLAAGKPAPDIPVFGITGLHITRLSGGETSAENSGDVSQAVTYRAAYTLWVPASDADTGEPDAVNYTDELTLARIKGNWRIIRIQRAINTLSMLFRHFVG